MPRLILGPLMLATAFALAACDPPLEELADKRRFVATAEGRDIFVDSRYDALQGAWYTSLVPVLGLTQALGPQEAIRALEGEIGTRICDGGRMEHAEGGPWSLTGDLVAPTGAAIQLQSLGGWQVIGRCA